MAYVVYSVALGAAVMVGAFAALGIAGWLGSLGSVGTLLGFLGGAVALVVALVATCFAVSVTSLLAPVVVLESKGIFQSVGRIFSLGSTAIWRVIGVVLTAGMIVGVPVFGAQMMIGFVPYLGVVIWAGFQAVGFAFTSAVAVVLYFDLRCRAENYDLELLAEQVEAGPGLGER